MTHGAKELSGLSRNEVAVIQETVAHPADLLLAERLAKHCSFMPWFRSPKDRTGQSISSPDRRVERRSSCYALISFEDCRIQPVLPTGLPIDRQRGVGQDWAAKTVANYVLLGSGPLSIRANAGSRLSVRRRSRRFVHAVKCFRPRRAH